MVDLTRAEIEAKTLWVYTHNAGSMDICYSREEAVQEAEQIGREMTVRPYAPLRYITQLLAQLDAETARADAAAGQMREAEQLAWDNGRADLLREQEEARLTGLLWASRGTE